MILNKGDNIFARTFIRPDDWVICAIPIHKQSSPAKPIAILTDVSADPNIAVTMSLTEQFPNSNPTDEPNIAVIINPPQMKFNIVSVNAP